MNQNLYNCVWGGVFLIQYISVYIAVWFQGNENQTAFFRDFFYIAIATAEWLFHFTGKEAKMMTTS